jgi:hypothetical protein
MFEGQLADLLQHACHVPLVLSAHSHINLHVQEGKRHYVGTSSFVEAPFEFKLIEIDAASLHVETIVLSPPFPFEWDYDRSRSYVQGRACDRSFSCDLFTDV